MKWIKYQIVCGKNENKEDILISKKVGYSEENIAIAETEAYNGYEIVEDEESYEKKPLSIEFGGTNANNGSDALKNLLAAGPMILSPEQLVIELPEPGIPGRVLFKKVGK